MSLPVLFIVLVLSFPLSSMYIQDGQYYGVNYDYKVLDSCTLKTYCIFYNSDSVSDNIPDNSESETFEGVTSEQFTEFTQSIQNDLQNVEENEIEQTTVINKMLELLTYLCGFVLFGVLVLLLTYIYKFFKIFF